MTPLEVGKPAIGARGDTFLYMRDLPTGTANLPLHRRRKGSTVLLNELGRERSAEGDSASPQRSRGRWFRIGRL
jgi:hypothetical protein